MRLVPTILIWCLVIIGVSNLFLVREESDSVLGAEANLPYGKITTVIERIRYLKELEIKFNSDEIREEIKRLETIP